jgi:anti-sigma regulatory factor (Ser/Thr protein kinase)
LVRDIEVIRLHLLDAPRAPSEARHAVRALLSGMGWRTATIDDALMVVSELVTNSSEHTGSDSVMVALVDGDRLRIEVHDRDPRPPTRIDPSSAGGFGLAIVETLSDRWGWDATDYGKRVWTELLC